jgi:cytochrome c oxidase subunit 3
MLLFLTSEVMFFAGLFAAYFNVRANAPGGIWPPINPETNEQYFLQFLPFVLPATVLLILSSFTAQFAVWGIRRGDRTSFLRNLSVTVVLGIAFLVMQAFDYALLYSEGITLDAGTFGSTFYTLTGFHGTHVTVGVIWLATMLVLAIRGKVPPAKALNLELAALYWHFVDVVWIVLFSVLYLLPGSGH